MLALLALFGPKQGLRIPLAGSLTLGRGATVDLQLVDGKVSREHCRIDATGARAMIEDLGSQNGTYVNGEAISRPTPVAEGDEIMVGDTLAAGCWRPNRSRERSLRRRHAAGLGAGAREHGRESWPAAAWANG